MEYLWTVSQTDLIFSKMSGTEPNQNTSSPPVFYISAVTLPSSHLALLEFKFSDLIKFRLGLYGFNLPMKNWFWHFIWLPCMVSKWAASLMKLFTGPATHPRWRRVNTHAHIHTCTLSHSLCSAVSPRSKPMHGYFTFGQQSGLDFGI